MTIQQMDNVGIVVEDLEAAVAFFAELGMELEGKMPVAGPWVDRIVGLDDVRVDIAMMRTPHRHSRLELMQFRAPRAVSAEPQNAPANTLGIRRIMFAVDDIEDVLARLRTHGAELATVGVGRAGWTLSERVVQRVLDGIAAVLGSRTA
jgi:catechol 2,3-dioxygenase-like lactoylglutathione lyase family enzyme